MIEAIGKVIADGSNLHAVRASRCTARTASTVFSWKMEHLSGRHEGVREVTPARQVRFEKRLPALNNPKTVAVAKTDTSNQGPRLSHRNNVPY